MSESSNGYYHIVDEKGDYFLSNDFNGKANFIPANADGTPPCTAFCMPKWTCEKKVSYLIKYTSHRKNPKLRGKKLRKAKYWINDFIKLNIIPKI